MEAPKDSHRRSLEQSPFGSVAESPLRPLTVSDYLRNLANQTVIHSQRADLIAEIRGNPSNDALRLRYAEHLEANPLTIRDKGRSELIRLQIDRGDSEPTPKERELLIRFERDWMRELGHARAVTWERGFITGVTMTPRNFSLSREPLELEPITHLRIHLPGGTEEGGKDLQAAVEAPHFKHLNRLSFWIGAPETLRSLERILPSAESALREIHFERFAGSIQEALETCSRVSYPHEPMPTNPVALSLDCIGITFGDIR